MMKLKRWLFEKSISQEVHRGFLDLAKKNKQVGILGLDPGNIEYEKAVQEYALRMRSQGSKVNILLYKDHKSETSEGEYYFKNQVKWSGEPFGESIRYFLEHTYDILLVLTTSYPKHTEYILRKTKAAFKAGMYHPIAQPYLDFAIDVKSQKIENTFEQLDSTLLKLLYNE